jgi:hypothetical protein
VVADQIWEYYYSDAARSIELMRSAIQNLTAERDRWRDIAYEYYLTDTDCSCHICDRYKEAAGIDPKTV